MARGHLAQQASGTIKDFIDNYAIYQAWARQGLERVADLFPSLRDRPASDRFELLSYSVDRPQRFFNRIVYRSIYDLLNAINYNFIAAVPDTIRLRFENAVSLLRSYNQQYKEASIDYSEHKEALRYYLHEHVFTDYLQLSENIYVGLLHYLLYAFYSQNPERYKNFPAGLIIDEPRSIINQATRHFKLPAVFDPLIRNAIAHGGVSFGENQVRFFDRNDKAINLSLEDARKLAEQLLDACNGIMAAIFERLKVHNNFSEIALLANQQEIAKMRTAFLVPEVFYYVERADGKQMEIHGHCHHWRWEELQLDIIRCLVIAREKHPEITYFSISLRDNRGMPHFYHINATDISNLDDDVKSIRSLHDIMQKNGMSWIENQRLIVDFVRKIPTFGTLFHWANEIDWVCDPKGNLPDFELRNIKDISVRHHSRFDASIISKPRAVDLDENNCPTADYLLFLYQETMIRWFIREGGNRNIGASRLRFFKTGIFFVYAEDRRLAELSDAEPTPNLLFRFESPLPIFGPLRMPGLGGGTVQKVSLFYVSVNPDAIAILRAIKIRNTAEIANDVNNARDGAT